MHLQTCIASEAVSIASVSPMNCSQIYRKKPKEKVSQGLQILLMSGVTMTSASQNFGVILEFLESSITRKKAIFQTFQHVVLACTVYTIVRNTRSSCGSQLIWKAQIHDGGHREITLFLFCRAV